MRRMLGEPCTYGSFVFQIDTILFEPTAVIRQIQVEATTFEAVTFQAENLFDGGRCPSAKPRALLDRKNRKSFS
jgi:hypothetical protein